MNLPIKLPFLDKKQKVEYYIVLLLRDEKVTAVAFEQRLGKISIKSKGEQPLHEMLEDISPEELTKVIDNVVSKVEEKLPAEVEIHDTVFGLKDSWVEDKKIKKDYLAKLKHVCSQLDLNPIGFIVLSEAIAHLIQQEEGAPVTALLTEVGQSTIAISLFRAGKLIETKTKTIKGTAMHSVDEALKEFEQVEILPSRIILFHSVPHDDASERDALAQKFIAHQWSKSLPFLHVPQISILPHAFDSKAMVAGAATQLGYTLATTLDDKTDIRNYDEHHHIQKGITHENNDNPENEDAETIEADKEGSASTHQITGDNFGFVLNKDISTLPPSEEEKQENISPYEEDEETTTPDEITSEYTKNKEDEQETVDEESFEEEEDEFVEGTHKKKTTPSLPKFPKFTNPLRNIQLPIPKKLLIIAPVVLILLIAALLLYSFEVKATVNLIVAPKSTSETEKITLSTTESNDFSQNIITAKEVKVSLNGTSTTNTTGQKEVGNKAKGTVTIYNSDAGKKTLQEGTTITSENDLSYTLDKEVTIASASGDIFTGIKSGTTQVAVTAKKIGNEYNLPSNTKFSVEGSNVLAAKNESAFSGGSKKKVTVVAQEDIDQLKEDLPKSLEQKAKEEMQSKLATDEVLASGFISKTLDKETLDNDLDEEAKTVKLTGTVTYTAIAYNKNDIQQFAKTILQQRYPQSTFEDDGLSTKVSALKAKDDSTMTGVIEITAGLLPKLDTGKIAENLVGKTFTQAQEYGRSVSSQVQDTVITLRPYIPIFPKNLPRAVKNITVNVKPTE